MRSLLYLLPWMALVPFSSAAEFPSELAGAVRTYYDQGAEQALPTLEALAATRPDRDDAAWWIARCQLELGEPEVAMAALDGRDGENIPAWRFHALAAQAALGLGDAPRALLEARMAMEDAPPGEGEAKLRVSSRFVLAGLSHRYGDNDVALAQLLALPEDASALDLPPMVQLALPELDGLLAAPLAPEVPLAEPLRFQARGSWWTLPAGGGLATPAHPPDPIVRECPGPDLCDRDGRAVLEPPGLRFTPTLSSGSLWYAAGGPSSAVGPSGGGIFHWSGEPAEPPSRVLTTPAGAVDTSPAPGPVDSLFFLRRQGGTTRLMRLLPGEQPVPLAPDLQAISAVIVVDELVVVAAFVDGVSSLRWLRYDAEAQLPSRPLLDRNVEAWTPRPARDERW